MTRPGSLPALRVHAGLAALVAVLAHGGYALVARPSLQPIGDAVAYRLLAAQIARGDGYLRPFDLALTGVERPTAEFPPGFPTLLAVVDLVGVESVTGQRLVLAMLAAVTAAAATLLARRILPPRGALAVGLAVAVHPALVQTTAALGAESALAATATVALLCSIRLAEAPSAVRAGVAGAAWGVAGMVRTEALLAGVLVLVVVALRTQPIRWRTGVAFLVALLALPVAWTARNLRTFAEPVPVATNLSTVLAGASCDATFDGPLVGFWRIGDGCLEGLDQAALDAGDESTASARVRDDALRYLGDHWEQWPRVAAIRVARSLHLYRPDQQARLAGFEGRRVGTERVAGWIVVAMLPAAAAGAAALARRRRDVPVLLVLLVPILVSVGTVALTYGNTRFRTLADVPLVILAGAGLRWAFNDAARPGGAGSGPTT